MHPQMIEKKIIYGKNAPQARFLVFLSRIGYAGWLRWFGIYVIFCNTLVLWGWSVINPGVSSGGTFNSMILPQGYWTGPGHELAGIAQHPTMSPCPSRRWVRGEPGELATLKRKVLGKIRGKLEVSFPAALSAPMTLLRCPFASASLTTWNPSSLSVDRLNSKIYTICVF